MRTVSIAAVAALLSISLPESGRAASLQVTPVGIEVTAPGAGSTVKLHNEGTTKINAQVRVFRWVQTDGQEKLEPTDDVVASPPMARLDPGADYTVRIVRLSRQPVSGEESYRLLIDELPDQRSSGNHLINLVLRHSIPCFFLAPDAEPAKLTWSIQQQKGRVSISADNDGDRHVRLAALNIRDRNGASVSFGAGLTGYVLGHSKMQWVAPATGRPLAVDNSMQISAVANTGPIHASPAARAPH
ncbi:MAG: molecular chaperone [Methylocystis sp.]|nr:molecular chaperone [Methylocystis sp.]